jgi:hypothetical protein
MHHALWRNARHHAHRQESVGERDIFENKEDEESIPDTLLAGHHFPRPQDPIPEWWVKR